MAWVILGALIIVGATVIGYLGGRDDDLGWIYAVAVSLISLLSVSTIVGIILSLNREVVPYSQSDYEYELVSINAGDYSDVEGFFRGRRFYVIGQISSSLGTDYKVYRKLSDSDYKLEHIPSSNSIIRYSDENPKVHVTTYSCPERELRAWTLTECSAPATEYVIYVPEGSIINEINL